MASLAQPNNTATPLTICRGVDDRTLKQATWTTVTEENRWISICSNILQQSNILEKLNSTTSATNASNRPNTTSIPKIIHQIWLGSPKPSTSEYMSWFQSWIALHPDWEIKWWHDKDVEEMIQQNEFINVEAYKAAQNYGEKSDILRYELLYKYGGLYVDTDMECVASFDTLHLNDICSFYAGWSNTGTIELNNGIFGAAPNHLILKSMIDAIRNSTNGKTKAETEKEQQEKETTNNKIAQVNSLLAGFLGGDGAANFMKATEQPIVQNKWSRLMATIEKTGPGIFTRHVLRHMVTAMEEDQQHASSIVILPMTYLYPVPNNVGSVTQDVRTKYVAEGTTLAIHHWAKSWQ